jgi:hypothetical protein
MAQTCESRPTRDGSRDAVCRRGSDSDGIAQTPRPLQAPRYEPRFRRQVEAVHRLGPVVLAYLVEAIASGADLRETVAAYAALDGNFITAYGGDRFPPSLRAIDGGVQ